MGKQGEKDKKSTKVHKKTQPVRYALHIYFLFPSLDCTKSAHLWASKEAREISMSSSPSLRLRVLTTRRQQASTLGRELLTFIRPRV